MHSIKGIVLSLARNLSKSIFRFWMSVFVVVALHAPGVETDLWMVDKADHDMEHMRGQWSVRGMPTIQHYRF